MGWDACAGIGIHRQRGKRIGVTQNRRWGHEQRTERDAFDFLQNRGFSIFRRFSNDRISFCPEDDAKIISDLIWHRRGEDQARMLFTGGNYSQCVAAAIKATALRAVFRERCPIEMHVLEPAIRDIRGKTDELRRNIVGFISQFPFSAGGYADGEFINCSDFAEEDSLVLRVDFYSTLRSFCGGFGREKIVKDFPKITVDEDSVERVLNTPYNPFFKEQALMLMGLSSVSRHEGPVIS